MNTKLKGEISEAKILARLLEKGEQVAIPFGDSQRYDLVVIEGERAVRVQCKTGWVKDGRILFKVVSHNPFSYENKGYANDVDVFMVYCFELNKVYLIQASEVTHYKYCVGLRVDKTKNNQTLDVRWAKDYEY